MRKFQITDKAEFKARQAILDFGALVQRVIDDTRAELAKNLARIKRQWAKWFPKNNKSKPQQLVLEANDFHQIILVS